MRIVEKCTECVFLVLSRNLAIALKFLVLSHFGVKPWRVQLKRILYMSNATNLNSSMSAGMGVDSDGRKRNHLTVDGIAEDRLRGGRH